MDLINFEKERKAKKDKLKKSKKALKSPQESCITKGRDNKEYFKYSVTYAHKGKNYSFDIWAVSKADAEYRVHSIKHHPVEIRQILEEGEWNGFN